MVKTLLATMTLMVFSTAQDYTCSDSPTDQRFCQSGVFGTEETYEDAYGTSETFRMAWEMYEGTIPLTQMALVWKEIGTHNRVQIYRTTGQQTNEVVRIRRIWQLPSKALDLFDYDDQNENNEPQLVNGFANMEYFV